MVDYHHVWHQRKWICDHSGNILQLKIIIRDLGKHACLTQKRKNIIINIGFQWFVSVFILTPTEKYYRWGKINFGCIPFSQSKSGFCDRKFEDQTNLRLQSEWSTSERGSFRLVSHSGFRSLFHLWNCFSIAKMCSFISKHSGSRLVEAKVIYIPALFYAVKGL